MLPADGKYVQTSSSTDPIGIDQIPLRMFRCADASGGATDPCQQPIPNVLLASVDTRPDNDGVLRRIPMFVQAACTSDSACNVKTLNPLGFAAYRAWLSGLGGPELQESNGQATFGTTWRNPMYVDSNGAALINYFGPPGNYHDKTHYISFGDVYKGNFSSDAVKDKIVLIGDYYLSGVHDEVFATTSAGAGGQLMPGVEMHANVVQMLIGAKFLSPEPPLVVFLVILLLSLAMAVVIARVSVVRGPVPALIALHIFTVAISFVAAGGGLIPNVVHPCLALGVTYT